MNIAKLFSREVHQGVIDEQAPTAGGRLEQLVDLRNCQIRTPQVLCRVRYQKSKPNLSTFLQKVLPPISEIEPNQISILYYIQHR